MELFPLQLQLWLAGAFLALLTFVLFLNIFGLPANWIILGLDALWKLAHPVNPNLGWLFWTLIIFLAIAGEGLELLLQLAKARKYGSSSSGALGGMIGAIVGAILLAPLFWGIGAFIGALAGAWLGCFIMEMLKGCPSQKAASAAFGTMLGRFMGTIAKIGIGAAMIALTARHIWPAEAILPEEDEILLTFLQNPHIYLCQLQISL